VKKKYILLLVITILVELTLFTFATYRFNRKVLPNTSVVSSASSSSSVSSKAKVVTYTNEYVKENTVKEEPKAVDRTIPEIPDPKLSYKVVSMMYHHINPDTVNDPKDSVLRGLSMSPAKFEEDLKDIKEKGYETVFPYEIKEKLLNNEKQEKKYVLLTIDDGYLDIYLYAFPLLKKYNMKATFYVIPNLVGQFDPKSVNNAGNYATWEQLTEMNESGLINIGSHTMDHAELTNKKYKDADLRYQIFNSKDVLQRKLGIKIKDFCYPYGRYNDTVVKLVKEAGYETATIIEGKNEISLSNIFVWKRFHSSETIPMRNYLK